MYTPFTKRTIAIIQQIPRGKVTSFGEIAQRAGNARGARQVSRLLHSLGSKLDLPWQRIVKKDGSLPLHDPKGQALQRTLLEEEGVGFLDNGKVDLADHSWNR